MVEVVEPDRRKDRKRRWQQHFFPQTARRDRCDACLEQAGSHDPLRAVLAAVPDSLLRACGGVLPPSALAAIRDELPYRPARQLADRIERRWWGSWSSRPLQRPAEGKQEGYGPDDVVLWLLTPSECRGGCEDGFVPGRPDTPCPVCRGATRPPGPAAARTGRDVEPTVTAADRTLEQAVAHRPPMAECTGRGGTCGVPVTAPYSQCPACLDWPRCACGRRYDPAQHAGCRMCPTS
ncbi:hypothetical protein [Streptomyces thioluteus]|uniref:hypothetical protein n=1 Tax=Streptomyces thioluteus TaxID=66431 RepID=UPI0031F17B42